MMIWNLVQGVRYKSPLIAVSYVVMIDRIHGYLNL